jgi:hypothetical protein
MNRKMPLTKALGWDLSGQLLAYLTLILNKKVAAVMHPKFLGSNKSGSYMTYITIKQLKP